MSVPSYLFYSLSLKLPNKGMDFPFPPLKLPNKRREEYSKIILFIPFHSIPFPPPKRIVSSFHSILKLHVYIYGSHSVKFAFIERKNIFLSVSLTYFSFSFSPPPKFSPKLFFPKHFFFLFL